MTDCCDNATFFVDFACQFLQSLVFCEVIHYPMTTGVIDDAVFVSLHLPWGQGTAKARHETLVVVPLPVQLRGHLQAVRVDGNVTALWADIVDGVAGLFDFLDKVNGFTQPQPGRPFEGWILRCIGQYHQNFLAHDPAPVANLNGPVLPGPRENLNSIAVTCKCAMVFGTCCANLNKSTGEPARLGGAVVNP
ncbi:hypothetical protein D9M71_482950 [compost metagenome]